MSITLERSITIDCPIETVWDYATTSDEWRKPTVKGVTPLSEGPLAEGSRYEDIVSMGFTVKVINKITVVDPPDRLAWKQENQTGPMYTVEGNYLLEPVGDGATRFTLKVAYETPGIWIVLSPVYRLMTGITFSRFLEKLKRLVEET
jgi:hypothetical protein